MIRKKTNPQLRSMYNQHLNATLQRIKRPVLVDGQEFESVRAAAKFIGVESAHVSNYLRMKRPIKGHVVEYAK
jgi:hypothetical protein